MPLSSVHSAEFVPKFTLPLYFAKVIKYNAAINRKLPLRKER